MTRIRYRSTEEGVAGELVSQELRSSSGETYKIYLYVGEFTTPRYEIVQTESMQVMANGTSPSASTVKMKAKKALAEFGITFEKESRAKSSEDAVA